MNPTNAIEAGSAGPHPSAPRYDFIVFGAGLSGSVVARRLAERPQVRVLLLEAGGDDRTPKVLDPDAWRGAIGSDLDWGFRTEPVAGLGGRTLLSSMGKVLGGGSGVNVSLWARGHRDDWDTFAVASGDDRWSYAAILEVYRQIESWAGPADAARRGRDWPIHVETSRSPAHRRLVPAFLRAAAALGIPAFDSHNGALMETSAGAAATELTIRGGERQSIFRTYVRPAMGQNNLTVLTGALVTRVCIADGAAEGGEFLHEGTSHRVDASGEVILCTGAIATPKLILLSGVSDADHLSRVGVAPAHHLLRVGLGLQDHPSWVVSWEAPPDLASGSSLSQALALAPSTLDRSPTTISDPLSKCRHPAPFHGDHS